MNYLNFFALEGIGDKYSLWFFCTLRRNFKHAAWVFRTAKRIKDSMNTLSHVFTKEHEMFLPLHNMRPFVIIFSVLKIYSNHYYY